MKKLDFLKIVIGLFLVIFAISCSKDDGATAVVAENQDVVFDITNFVPQVAGKNAFVSGKENGENDPSIPDCSDLEPSYVEMDIDGASYTLQLVTLNGKTETEVLKLAPGDYVINEFIVYSADGDAIWASPKVGSYYQTLWNLIGVDDLIFTVDKFEKRRVALDALCYKPYQYEEFGFAWFAYSKTEIHTVCFFGNICTEFFDEFHADGSPYFGQTYDGYDFPAIFSIVVKDAQENIVNDPEKNSNATWYGAGSPLCIEYPDQVGIEESFTFEIMLAMPDGSSVVIYTGTFDDTASSDTGNVEGFGGSDGVFDFTVGNCSYEGSDGNFDLPVSCFPYVQGFEVDALGWLDYNNGDWYGLVNRVPSGFAGISPSVGNFYAIFKGYQSPTDTNKSGPFTRFDGYSDTWPGTWTAEIDIYLDPSWSASQGFDYAVAANGTNNLHRRDFIFHVNKDASTGNLLVGASNNSSNSTPREDLETINHYQVTTPGWYTFQHVFSDNAGVLSVDLNLIDSGGNILFTETRSEPSDAIPSIVGGNRYGWFTLITVPGGIGVDNVILNRCQ